MKLIEEFSKVMGIILGLKQKENFREAEAAANEALKKFTETDINFLLAIDENELVDVLVNKRGLSKEQMQVIAELLFQIAGINKAKENDSGSSDMYKRSRIVFNWLLKKQNGVFNLEFNGRVKLLNQILDDNSHV